jgi:hypothetical protein
MMNKTRNMNRCSLQYEIYVKGYNWRLFLNLFYVHSQIFSIKPQEWEWWSYVQVIQPQRSFQIAKGLLQ